MTHPYPGLSLGIDGSANAVEHRLLAHHPATDLGVDGSAKAAEHRLLGHLNVERGSGPSTNAQEHRMR
jgi:hypothetical protein